MPDASTRPTAYPICGVLSNVRQRTDRKDRPYWCGDLAFTTKAGERQSVRAYAFGRAHTLVGRAFADGPTRLFGVFQDKAFHAISQGLPPKSQMPRIGEVVQAPPRAEKPNHAESRADATRPADPREPGPTVPVGMHTKMQPCGPRGSLRKRIVVQAHRRATTRPAKA